jgi:SAM-dependent methyltransferase
MDPNDVSFPLIWDTFTGYQRTAALKAAVELDVFTQIAAGAATIEALAARCGAAPRGVRALLNHLVADGFLTRDGERYGLSAAGVTARFRKLEGSAFDVPFGDGYDLVLFPNFLHHFDPPTCEQLLAKARAALAPGGRVVLVELVPDHDRSGPPDAVRFSLVMLASTPSGDAYPFAEYQTMFRRAGFSRVTLHDLPPSPARVVIAER